MGLGNLQARLVNVTDLAGGDGDSAELGDPPVGVARAVGGRGNEALSVGRPIVFVDVEVGGRYLPDLARSHVDHRQTLLVDVLLDEAGGRRHGFERACRARGILGEKQGHLLAVRRPGGRSEKSGQVGELASRMSRELRNVELKLFRTLFVRKEGEFAAVGRPGNVVLGILRVAVPGGYAARLLCRPRSRHINCRAASCQRLDPGNFLAVGRDCHLLEVAHCVKRVKRVVDGRFVGGETSCRAGDPNRQGERQASPGVHEQSPMGARSQHIRITESSVRIVLYREDLIGQGEESIHHGAHGDQKAAGLVLRELCGESFWLEASGRAL